MQKLQSCTTRSLITNISKAVTIAAGLILFFQPAASADTAAGAATFKAKCAMCHGADGAGKTAMGAKFNIPDLTSAEVQKKPDNSLVESIAKGKNKMPEFGSKLSAQQITQLKDYIREIGKKH